MSDRNLIIIFAAFAFISLFVISLVPNTAFYLAFKLILIVVISGAAYYLLYDSVLADDTERPQETREADTTSEVVVVPKNEMVDSDVEQDVESHFENYLKTLFPLIKQTMVANTVALLMVNYAKKKFFLRHATTDFPDYFSEDTLFDINRGLPALIFKNKNPLLENNLPESDNLLPYYYSHKASPQSFLGVPILFDGYVVGILCVDTEVNQAFSRDDLKILEEFSQLLSIHLDCSNRLFEFESENQTTKILGGFSREMLSVNRVTDLWAFVSTFLQKNFSAERIVIATRDGARQGKIVHLDDPGNAFELGQTFPDNEGLLGWVLRKNQVIMVNDFSEKDNYIPRMFLDEPPTRHYETLLAAPVSRNGKAAAVISMESQNPSSFGEQEKKILEAMVHQLAALWEKMEIIDSLKRDNTVDHETRLGNDKALLRDLDKEIVRCREFDKTFCLQLMKINAGDKKLSGELQERLLNEFVTESMQALNPGGQMYRYQNDVFGLIWPEKDLEEARADIEKVNANLVSRRNWVDGHVDKIFINTGLVQFPLNGSNGAEVLESAGRALQAANARGVNQIQVLQPAEHDED